jgi:hypothetical protein
MCLLDEKHEEAFEAFQSLLNINHLAKYRYKDLNKFIGLCNH